MFNGGNMFVNVTWKKEHHISPPTFWNLHNKDKTSISTQASQSKAKIHIFVQHDFFNANKEGLHFDTRLFCIKILNTVELVVVV